MPPVKYFFVCCEAPRPYVPGPGQKKYLLYAKKCGKINTLFDVQSSQSQIILTRTKSFELDLFWAGHEAKP